MSSSGTGSTQDDQTPQQIEAQIARTRQELKLTVDALSERLDPRVQAAEALDDAKLAAASLKRRATGETAPLGEPEPTRRGWVLLGAGAAAALGLVATLIRKAR